MRFIVYTWLALVLLVTTCGLICASSCRGTDRLSCSDAPAGRTPSCVPWSEALPAPRIRRRLLVRQPGADTTPVDALIAEAQVAEEAWKPVWIEHEDR